MDNHSLIRFAQSVLFDEQARADTRRQAKALLAALIQELPIAGGGGNGDAQPTKRKPGRPKGSKNVRTRAPASADTRSGQIAEKLKTFVTGKAELAQDQVFKTLGLKKNQSSTIEVGRALSLLGYASKRVGKGKGRHVVYTNAS